MASKPPPNGTYTDCSYKCTLNYNNIHRWGFGLIEFYEAPPAECMMVEIRSRIYLRATKYKII